MKLYIVIVHYHYDRDEVVSVHLTRSGAYKAVIKYVKDEVPSFYHPVELKHKDYFWGQGMSVSILRYKLLW